MPSITFDRFDGGLMLARPASTAPANTFSKMINFWPQPGGSLRNRPSWKQVPAITVGGSNSGLESNGGKLWVFLAGQFLEGAQEVSYPADTTTLIKAFLNIDGYPAAGSSVLQGTTRWESGFVASHSFPSGLRASVLWSYNLTSITGTQITDANCPMTGQMVTIGNRIYAISVDGLVVRFSKIGNPLDWTTAGDAGFLPIAQNFGSGQRAYALAAYQGKLAVFTDASIQIWNVDPDPTRMSIANVIDGVGTKHHTSIVSLQGDLLFLSQSGIRSLTTLQNSTFPSDTDVGLSVKTITAPTEGSTGVLGLAALPFAQYWVQGYNWDMNSDSGDGTTFGWLSWSYSNQAKLNAWAAHVTGTNPKKVSAWTCLNESVYARFEGDVYLYKMSPSLTGADSHGNDDPPNISGGGETGEPKACYAVTQWLDFKSQGLDKMLTGIDFDGVGLDRVDIYTSAGGQRDGALAASLPVGQNQDGWTYSGELIPISVHGSEFKLKFVGLNNVDVQVNRVTLYYENLR